MTDLVTFEIDREAHIARLRLNRPDAGNSVTYDMAQAICLALDVVERDDDIKVLTICGVGPHLSQGWDVDEVWQMFVQAPGGSVKKHPSQRARLIAIADLWWGPDGIYSRLLRCRKVTILQAQGDCFETGLFFALCCDLTVASSDARFACPRWRTLGVDGDMSLLIAMVGLKRAKDLMFTDRIWSAEDALAYGLLDWIASGDALAERVNEVAEMCSSIMRDGIVTEKYAVMASLEKMGIGLSFAAATVVAGSLSNIHYQPGEFNFLAEVHRSGKEVALARSRPAK